MNWQRNNNTVTPATLGIFCLKIGCIYITQLNVEKCFSSNKNDYKNVL